MPLPCSGESGAAGWSDAGGCWRSPGGLCRQVRGCHSSIRSGVGFGWGEIRAAALRRGQLEALPVSQQQPAGGMRGMRHVGLATGTRRRGRERSLGQPQGSDAGVRCARPPPHRQIGPVQKAHCALWLGPSRGGAGGEQLAPSTSTAAARRLGAGGDAGHMGCCLGAPWHQDLSLGCTGKLSMGRICLARGAGLSHAMGFSGILSPHPAAQEHPEHCRAHRALGAGAGGNAVPAAVAVCPRESRASGCQEHSWRAWDLLSAPGWGCFLPRIAKSFSSREVNESLARMGTTLHQHFQLVS